MRLMKASRRVLPILGRAALGCIEHDSFGMGAALAFYTVFSLGPLLVIATVVASRFIGDDVTREQLVSWARVYFGPEGAKAVEGMIAGALDPSSGYLATAVGAVTLFLGVTGVFERLKHSLNVIWGADATRHRAVRRVLLTKLKALAAAGLIGVTLFAGIVLSAGVMALGGFLGRWLPLSAGALLSVNVVLSLGMVAPFFALVFKLLPDARVSWFSAWTGGAVTAVLFQAGSLLTGAYLGTKVLASVYGTAGAVLAVLLWAYYTAQTVLFGAEVCREVGRRAGPATAEETPGPRETDPQPVEGRGRDAGGIGDASGSPDADCGLPIGGSPIRQSRIWNRQSTVPPIASRVPRRSAFPGRRVSPARAGGRAPSRVRGRPRSPRASASGRGPRPPARGGTACTGP